MTQHGARRPDFLSSASWFEPASIGAAIASLVVGALLAFALLTWRSDWLTLDGILAPGTVKLLLGSVWLALTVAGLAFGVIALVLPHARRSRAIGAILLSAVSLLALPAVAFAAFTPLLGPRHPSDEALIGNYMEHESAFAVLAARMTAGQGVDAATLRVLSIESAETTVEGFCLTVSSWGIVPSGSAKGYCYSSGRPESVVDDLDHAHPADGYTYRHLAGPWYLFYESW